MGLSQVYGFVQCSGGTIEVYSELGQGSHFKLYFPRHYKNANDDDELHEYISTADFIGSETLLIVDDEPALLNVTGEILKQKAYKVLSANSAKQVLRILENESIDLLLSDAIMPEMDGYQLVTLVKEKYPTIKFQLASGFTDDRHVGMVDEVLNHELLHKPYHLKTLLKKIRQLVT